MTPEGDSGNAAPLFPPADSNDNPKSRCGANTEAPQPDRALILGTMGQAAGGGRETCPYKGGGPWVDCLLRKVGNSASTPVPATRNCAVDYCIAASIGVTDIRVQ